MMTNPGIEASKDVVLDTTLQPVAKDATEGGVMFPPVTRPAEAIANELEQAQNAAPSNPIVDKLFGDMSQALHSFEGTDPIQAMGVAAADVAAQLVLGNQDLLDAISANDWREAIRLAQERGMELQPQTMWVMQQLGDAAPQFIRAEATLASSLPKILHEAAQSDDASEVLVQGVFEAVLKSFKDGVLTNDAMLALGKFVVGEYADEFLQLLQYNSEKAVSAMADLLMSKLALGTGKSGYDVGLSYLISIVYRLLPPEWKDAFLGALEGYISGKAVLDNKLELATDAVMALLTATGAVDAKTVAPLATPQRRQIDGTYWWVLPFSFGYVGIAEKSVPGPDVRVFWNRWNPATKQAFKVLDMVPLVGDSIIDLIQAGASMEAYKRFIDSLGSVSGNPDTIAGIIKMVEAQVVAAATKKLKDKILNLAASALRKGADAAIGILAELFGDDGGQDEPHQLQDHAQDLIPAVDDLDEDESEVQTTQAVEMSPMPRLAVPASAVESPQVAPDLEAAAQEAIRRRKSVGIEPEQADTRTEQWYPGRVPGPRGARF